MEVQYDCEKITFNDIISEKKFKIPSFQRNIVWTKKKRENFINTLRAGNPFGSILIYKNGENYEIIDGLQRITTIRDYSKDPFKYFNFKDINEDYIYDLLKIDYQLKNKDFNKTDSDTQKECENLQKYIFDLLSKKNSSSEIYWNLIENNKLQGQKETNLIIEKIVTEMNNKKNIDSLFFPAIIYKGSSENLPDIFYNLNTGGVNLSKYETFSASWGNKKYLINDDEIIDKIYDKYMNMKNNSDLEIDIIKEELESDGITLFEYCYSLSEILKNKYSFIFGQNKKSIDPVGFEILILICNENVNKAEKLNNILKDASAEFLTELKKVIVNIFEEISSSLKTYIYAKNGNQNTLDSTYMIYHMFISYLKHNYEIDLKNFTITNNEDKTWNQKFKKNLPWYYLKDYLDDFWKINRQVSDLSRELNNVEHLNKYTKTISSEEWKDTLTNLKKEECQTIGKQFSLKAKLFIDYLLKLKIMQDANLNKYFIDEKISLDYEHIIPKNRILKQIEENKIKDYPTYSLGNMCYLSKKDNRSKHDKTIYEFMADRPSFVNNQEYLDLINYPSEEEINFIDNRFEIFDKRYHNFLAERMDKLINDFVDLVISEIK